LSRQRQTHPNTSGRRRKGDALLLVVRLHPVRGLHARHGRVVVHSAALCAGSSRSLSQSDGGSAVKTAPLKTRGKRPGMREDGSGQGMYRPSASRERTSVVPERRRCVMRGWVLVECGSAPESREDALRSLDMFGTHALPASRSIANVSEKCLHAPSRSLPARCVLARAVPLAHCAQPVVVPSLSLTSLLPPRFHPPIRFAGPPRRRERALLLCRGCRCVTCLCMRRDCLLPALQL
jgi:hypothetical protein